MSSFDASLNPGGLVAKRRLGHTAHTLFGGPHRRAGSLGARRSPAPIWIETRSVVVSKSADGTIVLDGSRGEGGGQILRSSLTASMLTGRPFRLAAIRAGRERPGLRPQHLAAVEAAARLCRADVEGATVGSREILFRPGQVVARDVAIDIGTAGSTALVLQTLHLAIALRSSGPTRLSLTGGTFNTKAPSFPFLAETWTAHLADFGLPTVVTMPKAGFYPVGCGGIEAWIEPADEPRAVVSDRRPGSIEITGIAGVGRLPESIAERMRDRAVARLAERGLSCSISVESWDSGSSGAAISLTARTESTRATFVGLGERGRRSERVADDAVDELLAHLDVADAALDPHSADQLILPAAFASGRSIFTISAATEHLRTNLETLSAFVDRPMRVEEAEPGRPARVIIG